MNLGLLKVVIENEREALSELLSALDKQYRLIMKNNPIELEAVVDEIKLCNKNVAEFEVQRREILKGESFREIVLNSADEELEFLFRETKKLVELLRLQNESNELLIKQQLSYNSKMLMIVNPDRKAKTYNSYGRVR